MALDCQPPPAFGRTISSIIPPSKTQILEKPDFRPYIHITHVPPRTPTLHPGEIRRHHARVDGLLHKTNGFGKFSGRFWRKAPKNVCWRIYFILMFVFYFENEICIFLSLQYF